MKNKKLWLIVFAIIILIGISFGIYFYLEKDDFSINPIYPIKANIQVGGQFSTTINVINNGNKKQSFNVYFNEFSDLFSLSEKEFVLSPKESKEIKINFKDDKKEPNVYSGKLIVKTNSLEQEIPFLLIVQSSSPVFAITYDLASKSEKIYPGGVLGINLKIFDIQENYLKEAKINYLIKNLDGKIIYNEENRSFVIEGKSDFSRNFDIDKNSPIGNYVLITSIDYKGVKSVSGYLFEISKKKNNFFLNNLSPFMMLILVFFIGVIFLFIYFMKTRDDFLIKLKRQQNKELENNLKLIDYPKKNWSSIFHGFKRKKKVEKLNKAKRKIIKKIKSKHKKQRIELKKLKKKTKKPEIKKQLASWKKQGYKLLEAKEEIKKIPKKDQLFNWKKQGYKI